MGSKQEVADLLVGWMGPMIGFDIEKVAELIDLPDDHVMGPKVAIGKGTKDPWPKPGQLSLDEVVVEDRF